MSVSEEQSGVVESHVLAIQATALAKNTFVFIRPTEYDSTVLIKAGYATKSMDVHHKSSNWGPMAGFVPCDPAFSKKCEGKPNPDEHGHAHLAARPVHLALKHELLEQHQKIETQNGYLLVPSGGAGHIPWVARRGQAAEGSPPPARARPTSRPWSAGCRSTKRSSPKSSRTGRRSRIREGSERKRVRRGQ